MRTPLLAAVILFLCASSGSAAPPAPAGDKVIRDSWYTITLPKGIAYGYYNERVELRKGRLYFQTQAWKREEGFVNQEQLGAYAENSPELRPLFFNFHSTYRTTEINVDGTVSEGRNITIKARKGNSDLPIVKRTLPSKTIFAQFFPVWLGHQLSKLKENASASFLTLLEDSIDSGFSPVPGSVRLEKSDAFANESNTRRVTVTYRDMKSTWWVDETGAAVKINMHDSGAIVERVTKQKAEKSLSE